ncbi:MAG: immunoglobulin domain-containing protein, partial [Bacteroidota bacterium]
RSLSFDAKAESIGDYDVQVINTYGSVTSSVVRLDVNAKPVISRQPDDGLLVRVGGSFTNYIEASRCSTLTYRWQLNGRDLLLDTNHFVGTNGWLVVKNARTNDSGSYQVIVSNAAGTTNSQVARVEVLAAPPK